MLYEIVLNNGKILECWTEDENHDEVLNMMVEPHGIFIVRENKHVGMASYIMPDKVSHFRFPVSSKQTVKPI